MSSLKAPLDIITSDWRQDLKDAITDTNTLLRELGLSADHIAFDTDNAFPIRVTPYTLSRIRPGDPDDPVLRQVLPLEIENDVTGVLDPVEDRQFMRSGSLLHKYHGRVLMITTGACAIHCRYCFRRHFPYSEASYSARELDQTLDYLTSHPEVEEIILSGGDPLMLDDEKLAHLIQRLEEVDPLQYLRIHTRIPVVLPSRITHRLAEILRASRLRVTIVIHANHAHELGDAVARNLQVLHDARIQLLNQSVLLRGVNDSADSLCALSHRLHAINVLPYYLHLLDPVRGAMHFDVDEDSARSLIREIRERLPGFLVPKLVREIPNSASKTEISAF